MPAPIKKTKATKTVATQSEHRRFWLTYPTKLITRPVVWEMAKKFAVVFNIRQASVTDQIGILCLELEGQRAEIRAAIAWLEKHGVRVEPVEINVLES
ncbi:MAG: NIL domain-containing protein [Verrucomicrobia bacterium]|nr:NIL domain-containing protein [Verrucomicrobiota bacterium]